MVDVVYQVYEDDVDMDGVDDVDDVVYEDEVLSSQINKSINQSINNQFNNTKLFHNKNKSFSETYCVVVEALLDLKWSFKQIM